MKKVAQTYSLIRIVKNRSNVCSLKRKFGKKSLKRAAPHIIGFTCCEGSNDLNGLL